MLLLQLPIWSYIVVGTSVLAALGGLTFLLRARRDKQVDDRRARAAAGVLRMLNDEQGETRSGDQSSLTAFCPRNRIDAGQAAARW